VIRFSDGDVMEDLENVVRGIEGVVADLEEGRTSP
jgi:very-short-patch-repair endonuclease